ncbi:NAD(P)/FAD-dependent oxidoreductase [Sphingomonas prati]|uniref:Thioredoxin reductase n=1 Tax=Sphingomonas prati TaxID=1843237 RepID=A0A7W9F1K2_9SPHN|nr:NAD(P)/FAD-dependent oxidoreductase [Sphingomonas prati]MBB5729408.1 thioredoxin reductase (NADPH) [Sphingomonas prati]GGE77656.1 pyridine nucleotide-disulfide oxidoreductase [Sphingomonas prati]
MIEKTYDALVIGGGPAGLTAAIYLTRFHLDTLVVDAGKSRAALIPLSHNHAGYPEGVRGTDLLADMQEQAALYGAPVTPGAVTKLDRHADGRFFAELDGGTTLFAHSVLLATGVVNKRPPIDDDVHHEALERGLLRYCPVCDGYEVTDRKVGIIGTGSHGMKEAVFLRSYTRDVTLISPDAEHCLSDEEIAKLDELGVVRVAGPCDRLRIEGDSLIVPTPQGGLAFDSVYPALGSDIRSRLAVDVGADAGDDGCMHVDDHQRTSVPGLYAAGDVVIGLDQISHAMGAAGVAATTMRNDLAEKRALVR